MLGAYAKPLSSQVFITLFVREENEYTIHIFLPLPVSEVIRKNVDD